MKNRNKNKSESKPVLTSSTNSTGLWRNILLCILIAVSTFLIFKSSFTHEFVNWDDQVYIEEQPLVLKKDYSKIWSTPVSLNYHPLTMISLAYQMPKDVKKLSAGPFIKANVLLHIANSILVFVFVLMLGVDKWVVSFLASLVFALHPMHVESVVWVSERKDVLYTFFLLLSCITYYRYSDQKKWSWLLLAGLFFIFSVLSKAMGVVIPILWILIDYYKDRNLKDVRLWLEKLPFFLISLFFGLMAISVQSGGDFGGLLELAGEKSVAVAEANVFTLWQRLQFASYGFMQYIFRFFIPTELCAFYPYPDGDRLTGAGAILYPMGSLAMLALSVWTFHKNKTFTFAIGFYFITVALVLQFLSVGLAIMADRYTYVPYIGISFLVFMVLNDIVSKRGQNLQYLFYGAGLIFVIYLGYKTYGHIPVWKNSETLWTHVLEHYPKDDLALATRGNHRGKTGNINGAMEDFEKAVSDGCERADVYEGLGNSYGTMSDQQPEKKQELVNKALEMYKKALAINPSKGNIHFNLGIAQLQTNPAASMAAFEDALRLMPYKASEILPMLGMSQLNAGKYTEAVATITKAIESGVITEHVYHHRGLAYIGLGAKDKAKADLQKALELNPQNQEVRSRLTGL